MKLIKTIRLSFTLYRSFMLASLIITICCAGLLRKFGMGIFVVLFWLKVITLGLFYYFINSYKKKEYYYYQNLGVSKRLLWTTILLFDVVLFIFLLTKAYTSR